MNKDQEKLMDMYKLFTEEIAKTDINWVLYAGNQLGAVREKGWIPWDDDIDVAIGVEDREKLMDFFKDNESFTLGAPLTNTRDQGFIKLFSNKYTFKRMRNGKMIDQPIWIDVFTMFKRKKPTRSKWEMLWVHYYFARNNVNMSRWINIAKLPLRIVPIFVIKRILTKRYKVSGGDYWFEDTRLKTPLRGVDVTERVWVDFCGVNSPIFKQHHEYLSSRYGDNYMTPHTGDKRKSHHVFGIEEKKAH